MRRSGLGLRPRLALLVGITLVASLGLALRADLHYRHLVIANVQQSALSMARMVAQEQDQLVSGTELLLATVARMPALRAPDPHAALPILTSLLQQDPRYRNFGLTDLRGDVLASAVPMTRKTNWASGLWFQEVMRKKAFGVGDYQLGRVTGKPSLHFGYPVRDGQGRIFRLVYCAANPDWMATLVEQSELPAGATLTVTDRQGTILARHPQGESWVGKSAAEWQLFSEALSRQQEGTTRAMGLDGIERLYAFTSLKTAGTSVQVAIGLPEDVAFEDLDRITLATIVWTLLAVLLVMVLVAWGSRILIVEPMNALVTAARKFGGGDLSARADLAREGGEIGELGRAFNDMAGALQRDVRELQRAEDALRRENVFISTVLQTLGALVVILDHEGRIVRFNKACEEATGYTFAEMEGKLFYDFLLSPEEAPAVRDLFGRLTAGMFPLRHENHWVAKDGTKRLIAWNNSAVTAANGQVEYVVGTGIDVTHRRQAEEEMARLNSVLKAIRDVNQLIRAEPERGRMLEASCAALIGGRGYTKAWVATYDRSGNLAELYSEGLGDKAALLRDMIGHQALPQCARGAVEGQEVVVWVASGEACAGCDLAGPAPCPTRMTVGLTHEGRTYGVLCVCLPPDMQATAEEQELLRELADDIGLALHMLELAEDERDAQRSLALERDRLRALLQLSEMTEAPLQAITDFALEEAVRLTSSTIGYLAFTNEDESVLTMHSWSKTAMSHCAIIDKPIVYPVVNTGLWGEAVRQRKPVVTNDYEAPSPLKKGYPEGHVPVLRHMNIPVFDGERIVGVAGVGNKEEPYDDSDIRQLQLLMNGMWRLLHRKQAEEALRRAYDEMEQRVVQRTAELARSNAELEQFAYVASHDLQEPLRKITAFGQRLEQKLGDTLTDDNRDYLQRMQSGALRMQGLINDLLTYSRVTTQAQPFGEVDLGEVVADVLSDLEIRIEESGAQVEVGPLPTLEADRLQMQQVLQNLIANALKFRREGVAPVVRVSFEPLPTVPDEVPRVRLQVQDNGIGFESQYAERIFGVFQRLHGRDEYPGSGIGLAICRKIVDRHHGTITATSEPGVGTTFALELPLRQPAEEEEG